MRLALPGYLPLYPSCKGRGIKDLTSSYLIHGNTVIRQERGKLVSRSRENARSCRQLSCTTRYASGCEKQYYHRRKRSEVGVLKHIDLSSGERTRSCETNSANQFSHDVGA